MAKAIFTRYKLDAEGDRVELPLDAPWDEEENDSLVNFSDPLNKPWTRYCGCRDMKENLGYCVNCGYKIQPEPQSPSVVPCLQCSRHEVEAHLATAGLRGSQVGGLSFQVMIGIALGYLTVQELADLLHVSQPTIKRWANQGLNLPAYAIREAIACTLDPLLGYHNFLKGVR